MWEKAKAGNDRIGTIDKKSQTSFGIRLFAEFLVPQVPKRCDKGTSKSSYAAQVRGFEMMEQREGKLKEISQAGQIVYFGMASKI